MASAATVDLFEMCATVVPGAPKMGAYRIVCAKCRAQDKVSSNRHLPPDAVSRMFRVRGWSVSDRNRHHHLCPECVSGVKKPRIVQMSVAKPAPPAKKVADAPPSMTRDDRRIIFAKLNEVYVDEKVGYSQSWSDQRVANDLSVPRAWVTEIREENFGPDGASEEVRGVVAQARALVEETRKHIDDIERTRQAIDDLSKRIAVIETTKGPLKEKCDRIEAHVSRVAKQVGLI